MEKFEVFAQTQESALQRRKEAETVSSFLSSDLIGALPDDTLGDALTRLAGANVVGAGEARAAQISIRGMEGKLNLVQINGVGMAQANALISGNLDDTRNFDPSGIPAEMVQSVEVVKSITADRDAEAIGGLVNVETANSLSLTKRVSNAKAEWRYREQGGETGYGFSATYGDVFGARRNFGAYVNVTYKDDESRSWRTEFRQANTPAAGVIPELERFDLRDIAKRNRSLIVTGSLDYRLGADTTLFFRPYVSRRTLDEFVNQKRLYNMGARSGNWYFLDENNQPLGTWTDLDNDGTLGSAGDRFTQQRDAQGNIVITPRKESAGFRVQLLDRDRPDRKYETNALDLGGRTKLEKGRLEYRVNWSEDSHRYTGTQVQWDTPNAERSIHRFRYDNSNIHFPTIEAFRVTASNGHVAVSPRMDRFDATNADLLNRIRFQSGDFNESQWVGQADYTRDIGSTLTLKLGAKVRWRDRESSPTTVDWSPSGISIPRSQFQASYGESITAFDDRYAYAGRLLPTEPVLQFFETHRAANPGNWRLQGLDINDIARRYGIDERVSAAYALLTWRIKGLTVLGGLRAEATNLKATWRASTVDPLQPGLPRLDDIVRSSDYTNVFPSLVATYRLGDRHVFRAAATSTISRPDYVDIIPYRTSEVSEVYAESLGEFDTFPLGNPDLSPQTATNFDLGWEYYHSENISFSVTGFYKQLDDFLLDNVFEHEILVPSDPFNPSSPKVPTTVESSFVSNSSSQEIRGLEFTLNGSLAKLPKPLNGLGWVLNYTLVDGEQTQPIFDPDELAAGRFVKTGELTGQGLTNQPERIANLQVYYDQGRFSLRFAYNYVDDFKLDAFTVGFAGRQAEQKSLDGSLQVRLSKKNDWRLLVNVSNITEEPANILYVDRWEFPEAYEESGRSWVVGIRGSF